MDAQIYFYGDKSADVAPYKFKMEFSDSLKDSFDDDPEYRERIRDKIKELYFELHDDEHGLDVIFSDENTPRIILD